MINSFKHFKESLSKLTPKELLMLKKKLEMKFEAVDKNKSKSKELLKLVLKNPQITRIEIEKKLYDGPHRIAFDKLVDRANEKIDEIFLGFGKESTSIYSLRNYYYYFLKRKLLLLQIKWFRGLNTDLESQFDKIILLAEKYELYEILVDVLYVKQRYIGYRYGQSAFNKIESAIESAEFKRKAILNSRRLYSKITSRVNQSKTTSHVDELKNYIGTLEQYYSSTKSSTILLFLNYLQVEWLHINSKYVESEKLLKKLLNLLLENSNLYTKIRHSNILLNLASNQILLGKFDMAIQNTFKAQTYLDKEIADPLAIMEIEFYARFYKGEVAGSEKLMVQIYNNSQGKGNPILYNRRAYLLACINTVQNDPKKSQELLTELKEIDKDKAGWNLGKRLLSIINEIELNDYENAELKILSLEKFIKRISATYTVRKRDKAILRILLKLINENFDFNKVYLQRKNYFDLLESSDADYAWKIMSPELIKFHDWFKSKMKQQTPKEIPI
jgi:hypothetical protein